MGRAERRNDKQRMKDRAKKILKRNGLPDKYIEDSAVRLADNMKSCQHTGCCNPRRHLHEITRKEQENLLNFKEQQ